MNDDKVMAELMMMRSIYKTGYVYHYLSWLQSGLSLRFLEAHGASQNEMTIASQCVDRFISLERLWPQISPELQEALANQEYGHSSNIQNPTILELSEAIRKLANFSKLCDQQRTKLLDVYFPHLSSNSKYPHNLHTIRLNSREAVWMIGLMDPIGFQPWVKLLDELDKDSKKLLSDRHHEAANVLA